MKLKTESDRRIKLVRFISRKGLTKGDIADIVMTHRQMMDERKRLTKEIESLSARVQFFVDQNTQLHIDISAAWQDNTLFRQQCVHASEQIKELLYENVNLKAKLSRCKAYNSSIRTIRSAMFNKIKRLEAENDALHQDSLKNKRRKK